MNQSAAEISPTRATEDLSLLDLAAVLLRSRRLVVGLGIAGGLLGLTSGLLSKRQYSATATFIPQGSESGASSLALSASQFGIRLPSSVGGSWGPPVYAELLRSRTLLDRAANDTVLVVEEGNRRVALRDLLGVEGATPAEVGENAYAAMSAIVRAAEVKSIGGVKLTVTTPWPSVSFALANRLVQGVNDFILQTRKSAASSEREFAETQARNAERALRAAEDSLLEFDQRNRIAAGEARVERGRLEREMLRHEAIYTALLQSREEAKLREVRETLVITMLETPRLPHWGESRKTVVRAIIGGTAGVMVAIVIALSSFWFTTARQREGNSQFFQQLQEVTSRTFRKRP